MPKKVNITIGRFQPFTQGHLNMIEEGELPCIVYRINSSDRDPSKIKGKKITKQELERVSEFAKTGKGDLTEREKELLKRPFSNELIEKELNIVKRNNKKIIDIIYVKNAYEAVEDFNNKVKEGEYEPHYLMCGDDRVEKYRTLIKSFPDLDGVLEPNIGLGRSSGVSGSLVRKAILEKGMSSSTILSSYTDVLAAATGSMFTTMSQDEMADLVKMQLNGMPSWEIRKHSVKGEADFDFCYALGDYASVVYPIQDEITMAVDEIAKTKLMD